MHCWIELPLCSNFRICLRLWNFTVILPCFCSSSATYLRKASNSPLNEKLQSKWCVIIWGSGKVSGLPPLARSSTAAPPLRPSHWGRFFSFSFLDNWKLKDRRDKWADKTDKMTCVPSEDLPRLIWVFAGRTSHFVGFDVRWLRYDCVVHSCKKS